jgi:phosphoribosylglycinamide formyltransferase-1
VTKLKTAVLISGRGSNMEALIQACAQPDYPAEIVLVLANVPDAVGIEHAKAAGVPVAVIPHRNYDTRDAFDSAVDARLREAQADLVCLAGFMRILTEPFVRKWQGRLINIHPSLLPSFKGTEVHEQAIDAGVRISGCTVHYVTPELDSGLAIAQAAVPVHADDNAERLAERVLLAEHKLYPLALRLIAEGRVQLYNGRVIYNQVAAPESTMFNPTD